MGTPQGDCTITAQSPYQWTQEMKSSCRRKAYWFEGMRSFIKNFCDSCMQCTTIPKKSLAPLKPFRAGYPGMVLQLDCTPGPKHKKPTEHGNSHILAILESFSNHVRLFAVPDPNAKLMAECLLAYISVHSMPLQLTITLPMDSQEIQKALAGLLKGILV